MIIPVHESFSLSNIALALLLGFLAAVVAVGIHWLVRLFAIPAKALDSKYHWTITALLFGLVLGVLYLVGGQSVQFSGSEGLKLLTANIKTFSALALLGLVIVKMLATSWSLATGYRGGLVFPSIYTGVALSLATSAAFHLTGVNEAGTTIGASSGILVSMTNPLLGIVLSFSLFPLSLLPVVTAGAIGAYVGHRTFARLMPAQ